MGGFTLTWKDIRLEPRDINHYIPKSWLHTIEKDFHAVALRDITFDDKTYYQKGDTLAINPENFYYEIEYREPSGKIFTLFPRIQLNEAMGGLVSSPDIRRELDKDLYTYVAMVTNPTAEPQWSASEEFTVAMRDTFFINDFVAILDNVVRTEEVEGVNLGEGDAAVKAIVRVLDQEKELIMTPTFVIRDKLIGRKPVVNDEIGVRLQFKEIDPKTGKFTFTANTTQRDFIVMKAIEKPLINILWLGTFVLSIGFVLATIRRFRDFIKMRDKEEQKVAKQSKLQKI
jgi:cytochrome c-type biogenesis protein CcmF